MTTTEKITHAVSKLVNEQLRDLGGGTAEVFASALRGDRVTVHMYVRPEDVERVRLVMDSAKMVDRAERPARDGMTLVRGRIPLTQ